jgi:hypothetical protein
LWRSSGTGGTNFDTWEKDQTVKFGLNWVGNKIEGAYAHIGDFSETSLTNSHIGVGINASGDLIGTNADGSAQNTVTLTPADDFSLSHTVDVRMELTAGSQIEWFVDGESKGTSTTNLPYGNTGTAEAYGAAVWNAASGGSDGKLAIGHYTRVILP